VIGSMADLSAASLEDTKEFFRKYYAPNNAVIVVAGDVKTDSVQRAVRQLFSDIPRGPAIERPVPSPFTVRDTTIVAEDRVQLPRLLLDWHTVKRYHPDEAALEITQYLLTGARNARLTSALVYDEEVARDVYAYNGARKLDGEFGIMATARPGTGLDTVLAAVEKQLARLATDGPNDRELQQARNALESQFLNRLEFVDAKADRLNEYYYFTGNPDGFQGDLDRFRAVTADDVKRVVARYLTGARVTLSIVPQGKKELAVTRKGAVQ